MLVTPQLKDLILRHFVDNYQIGQMICIPRSTTIHGITGDVLDSIIRQFVKLGLFRVGQNGHMGSSSSLIFWVNIDSHDLIQEGGFFGKYQLFQANVEKLLTEVDKLDAKDVKVGNELKTIRTNLKDYLDIISKVSTLANNFGNV